MATNYASRHRHRGFTLVELIVAMVILSILAAIAIPSYSQYVLKSHRTEAKSALLDAASLEERFFSTSNLYTNNPTQLGYGVAATDSGPGGHRVLRHQPHQCDSACGAHRIGPRRDAGHLHDHRRPRRR